MANRTFQTALLQIPKRIVHLYPVVSVGVAGAVTLQKRTFTAGGSTALTSSSSLGTAPTTGVGYAYGDGAGTRSVSLGTAGLWTITFSDSYQYLLGVEIAQTKNATGLMTAATVGVKTNSTITTNTAVGNGGVIAIQLADFAGNAVDPASGDVLTLRITLGDATEP
jgi:hypothetical protein